MTLLLMCGGMGVAAFHPEAATMAGNLSPNNRNRWLALFALSGYLGQAVGPAYGGSISDHFGLQGLTNNFYWCLPALTIVGIFLHWFSSKQANAPSELPETNQPTVYRRGSALGDDAQQLDLMVNQVGWRRRGEALHAIAQQSSAAPLQAMRS